MSDFAVLSPSAQAEEGEDDQNDDDQTDDINDAAHAKVLTLCVWPGASATAIALCPNNVRPEEWFL